LTLTFITAQASRRTEDYISRSGVKSSPDRDPGAAGITANQFLGLLVLGLNTIGDDLLEVTNRAQKLSPELDVRAQQTVKEKKQQRDQRNYNQVSQIPFSAVKSGIASGETLFGSHYSDPESPLFPSLGA